MIATITGPRTFLETAGVRGPVVLDRWAAWMVHGTRSLSAEIRFDENQSGAINGAPFVTLHAEVKLDHRGEPNIWLSRRRTLMGSRESLPDLGHGLARKAVGVALQKAGGFAAVWTERFTSSDVVRARSTDSIRKGIADLEKALADSKESLSLAEMLEAGELTMIQCAQLGSGLPRLTNPKGTLSSMYSDSPGARLMLGDEQIG